MDSLVYSLNVVTPIFLLVIVGYALRRMKIMSPEFAEEGAKITFKLALPFSLFRSICNTDISQTFRPRLVITTLAGIIGMFLLLCLIVPRLVKSRPQAATIVQGIFRTNFLILGVPMARNMFGEEGLGPTTLLLAFAIPSFNVLAIIAFTLLTGDHTGEVLGARVRKTLLEVLKNPLFCAAVLGMVFSLLHIRLPSVLDKAMADIGSMATPLALLTMGAQFDVKRFRTDIKVSMLTSLCRVVVCPCVIIGAGILLGFRGSELGALFVLFSAPTAGSSYVMSQNMGGGGDLASQIILVSTFLSMFTITAGIYLLKLFALI